jgi:hypothetical protein
MITTKIPSYETYRVATRPVVMASLVKMLDYLDITVDQKIFFNNEAEVSKLLGGEGKDKRGADVGTDYGYDNKLFVEFENNEAGYNDELDTFTGDYSNPALWYDPITKSRIAGKFKTRRYEVTVNAYFKDRVTAQRYLTNIQSKTMGMHQNSLLEFDTHYPTTYPQLQCFKEIYDRLVIAGQIDETTTDFIGWMIANSQVPSGILRNVIFNNPVFVFKQRIVNIGINMENPSDAKVVSGNFIGKFEVSFRYWFHFSEHIEWVMNYPIQVYQQPMPTEYLPAPFVDYRDDPVQRRFFENAIANRVWNYKRNVAPFYHIFPNQDNWRPNDVYWLSPQLQVLIGVENVESQVLLNMKEINGFTWDPVVLKYMLRYNNKLTKRHKNPMHIKVWSDDNMNSEEVLDTQITLTESGDLSLSRLPRIGNTYRVVFYFDFAIRLYDEECIKDILDDPEYAKWIIGVLFPHYPWPDDWTGTYDDWIKIHNGIDVGDGDELKFYMRYGILGSLIIAHNTDTRDQYLDLKNKGVIDGSDYYRSN